jgi:hypothetical protein
MGFLDFPDIVLALEKQVVIYWLTSDLSLHKTAMPMFLLGQTSLYQKVS